jgi:hypothetical protein
MTRKYHTLIVREDDKSPWTIHFGDYDRNTVWEEKEDLHSNGLGYKKKNMKIITTTDAQADIARAVRRINEGGL